MIFIKISRSDLLNRMRCASSSCFNLNIKMKQFIDSHRYEQALDLFDQQTQSEELNDVILNLALKACTKLNDRQRGIEIHRRLSPKSLGNCFIQASLIHFYMQCHDIDRAEQIFSVADRTDAAVFGAMMKGYISNGIPKKAIELFEKIPVKSTWITWIILLNACAKVADPQAMKIGRNSLDKLGDQVMSNQNLINAAIDMLMKFGDVEYAERLFNTMTRKTFVTYGSMMQGYVVNDLPEKALNLFENLSFEPNRMMYAIAYSACASLSNDKAVRLGQAYLRRMPKSYLSEVVVIGSILHMLMKFGRVEEAEHIFSQIEKTTVCNYGVMMNGYNINNQFRKCLKLFEKMQKEKIAVDEATAVAVLTAVSQIGLLSICQRIVQQIPDELKRQTRLKCMLIDMWGKVGSIDEAREIFQSIEYPDVFAYNSMINSYGRNGLGIEAVYLYRQMPDNMRDSITHICVLNACSHSGLVDEARLIFDEIKTKNEKIITAMIDCLCRMFFFDEAQILIAEYEKSYPPYCPMYMTMLSSARNHRDAVLSRKLFDRMQSLFPDLKDQLIAASILLANTYRSVGDHMEAEQIRTDRIKHLGNKIKPGCSWTEVNGELVEFKAHDRSHPRSSEIYAELYRLTEELKEHNHHFDSSWITRPLKEDETIETVLCGHSERLAIGYNLIQDPRPSVIQITKNLRVCGDCHRTTKLIAKLRQCEIIVRDTNRIHHFHRNGQCSCQDHF